MSNRVVSSGVAGEKEVDVPRTKLMPVNQYMIKQAELSRSAPLVQPYRKSSALSQPKKVTFGPTTYIEEWRRVSYGRYGKRQFEVVVSSAIQERKIAEHPIIEEVVDEDETSN